ncbi:Uncharacterised protein [Aeromonas encheleia]|uniref:hypothetical protein n=1 Tax=Aeromonas TaxID=642 RepID=UPI0005B1D527|nr:MULTISPECIES: hypothetical protein [Aeromonas]MBV7435911.1 hypothetical protein [Aeromonas sp. sif2416]VEG95745.1 Uncharacterised protein [Aeromonas encheleia]
MNLFKRFMELVPGADPLLVGTVTATTGTSSTLEALGGGVVVRGGGVAIGQKAFYQAGAIVGSAPDLPTYEIEV